MKNTQAEIIDHLLKALFCDMDLICEIMSENADNFPETARKLKAVCIILEMHNAKVINQLEKHTAE